MSRRGRAENKSFYHYEAQYFNNGKEDGSEYFMTAYDLVDRFGCSRKTIMDKIKYPSRKGRWGQFANVIIKRVQEPVYIRSKRFI